MPIHKVKLLNREEVASNTVMFRFEKPAGFAFKPGQYGGFTLINPQETDAGGITRRFSFLSTPDDGELAIVTRIQQSAYKRVLNALPIGSEVKLAGPSGTFTLHNDAHIPAVLIAGGIGIAPFYSMLRYAAYHVSPQDLFLFYGNQNLKNTAFLAELMQLQMQNPHFKLIATMDKAEDTWQGERGFITSQLLKKNISAVMIPIYYICGSPAMVTVLQETLVEMGIDEDKIRVEDFPGY
ncbi:MAG: hypothetical protein A3E83_01835 [Gammaproteobacteria bacterium RIFCSPHIGHO2_12_FULL_41_20]|nr:MAG: hypothetical protein A3E83_01835 [Gammaproteobacteria bacterium RIFCSPHIGHO2_12_FULL_41_20]